MTADAFKKERERWRKVKKVASVQDEAYERWIRKKPCCVCLMESRGHTRGSMGYMLATMQRWKTEAAHTGPVRGLRQKCGARELLPLCALQHHREGRESIHRKQKSFWTFHGLDREKLVADHLARYEQETGRKVA